MELLFLLLPLAAVAVALRHGPLRNPWWKGENPLGFGLFVGGIAFLVGFLGPMILNPQGNQGPLLGIFITGPGGFVAGTAWGMYRAVARGRGPSGRPSHG